MTLDEWYSKHGTKAELSRLTGLNWPTLERARLGRATEETAQVIRAATKGKVSKDSMTRNNRARRAALAKLRKFAS